LFTAPPGQRAALAAIKGAEYPACHCIGEITVGRGVRVRSAKGDLNVKGFDHFRT
jgi:hypothetical protein